MIDLSNLRPPRGARRPRKRVGRGEGSGHGKTCGYGTKGQKVRAGRGVRPYFEGGQMPLTRRVPKRGFRSPFHRWYAIVNLRDLNAFEPGSTVDPEELRRRGKVKGRLPVKLLAKGEIDRPLVIRVHAASQAARRKVEAAGGRVEVIEG